MQYHTCPSSWSEGAAVTQHVIIITLRDLPLNFWVRASSIFHSEAESDRETDLQSRSRSGSSSEKEKMPCLNTSTNVSLDGVATSSVAKIMGKPEAVGALSPSPALTFSFNRCLSLPIMWNREILWSRCCSDTTVHATDVMEPDPSCDERVNADR